MADSQILSVAIEKPLTRDSLEKTSVEAIEVSNVPTLLQNNYNVPNFVYDLQYSKEEEAKVICMLDTRLFSWILLTTFVLNMDRANISNAVSDNLPTDIGFNINVVNTGTMVHSILFAILTPTGALIAKQVGPPKCMSIHFINESANESTS